MLDLPSLTAHKLRTDFMSDPRATSQSGHHHENKGPKEGIFSSQSRQHAESKQVIRNYINS